MIEHFEFITLSYVVILDFRNLLTWARRVKLVHLLRLGFIPLSVLTTVEYHYPSNVRAILIVISYICRNFN